MADVLWPTDLAPSAQTWNIIGNAASFVSPLNGATRTYGRPGVRMGCTITLPPINGQNRARIVAVLAALKDRSNRILVPDFSTSPRGSFPYSELLTNYDFSNGTTGWSVVSGGSATPVASVNDRVYRATRSGNDAATQAAPYRSGVTVTQYAPHVVRAFLAQGKGSPNLYLDNIGVAALESASQVYGLRTAATVPLTTSISPGVTVSVASGDISGDFYEVSLLSLSRCPLIDGSPNGLLYSDQFDNAAHTKTNATITANDTAAPDGTATADALVENTTSGVHQISQAMTVSASAIDLSASVRVKAGTRSWAYLGISDFTAHGQTVYVNLSTGALGSTVTDGTNVTNPRAAVVNEGNGWYRIHLTARKSGSQVSMYLIAGAATGDTGMSYSGTAAAKAVYLWRAGMAVSGVPFLPAQTTSAATTGSTQTGNSVRVKGLPASTNGLLYGGDMVDSSAQANYVTAPLNSDAAGTGVLMVGNPFRTTTNDTPINVNAPMCKMLLSPDQIDIDTMPGRFSPITLELVEAID